MSSKETVEGLIEDLGGCGVFQMLMAFLVHCSTMPVAWSTLYMAYGNYNPGWTCEDADLDVNASLSRNNGHVTLDNRTKEEASPSCAVFEHCDNVVFNNHSSTIVTEWSLVCSRYWIISMIISFHMVGNLIGALIAGHTIHYLGRKKSHYGMLLIHCAFNIIAMFANDWPMYAALRLILGITTTSVYISVYLYPLEFVVSRWRGAFTAIPISNSSYLIFAVMAMYLRDWRLLHLATAIVTFIWCLPVLWAPESLHWLIIKGKILKAHRVSLKIARINKKPALKIEKIQTIAQREKQRESEKKLYTVLDLYRHGYLYWTFVLTISWMTFTFVYFSIFFGVKNISGDFYINLMIFSFITTFSYPLVPLLSNTTGRKWGIIIFLLISILCYAALVSVHFVNGVFDEGLAVMIVSLVLLTCVDGAWSLVVLFGAELYPTALRSLSYSHFSCLARVGGMVAPFLIPEEQRSNVVLYFVLAALSIVIGVFIFLLPETKGKHMMDSMRTVNKRQNWAEEDDTEVP